MQFNIGIENPVRFSNKVDVRYMHCWSFAYKQSRNGQQWMQNARDRERFHRYIQKCSVELNKVLTQSHRDRKYKELYDVNQ